MNSSKSFIDTYKKYIRKGWYDLKISTPTLERWCDNFAAQPDITFDPQICAHFLLNSLIFYQEKQLEAIIIQIQDRIKSEINQSLEESQKRRLSDGELNAIWEDYKKQSCIIAAASPSDVADSAHQAARLWRNIAGIDTGSILDLRKIIEKGNKKHIYFVDDFIGTGTKMNTFLSQRYCESKNNWNFEYINDIINSTKNVVDFNVIVYAIYENGRKTVQDNFPSLNFYYGDMYTDEYNIISDDCVLYDLFEDDKENIIAYINEKLKDFSVNKYVLYLPISFHHGCPNNSLPLYYVSTSNWCNLLTESHPRNI